jgi:SulP family sulfate permease
MAAQVRARANGLALPKIGKPDLLAAVTTGVANIPDGMASASLAGVNPVYGIYTLIIGTPIAALSISTQLMMFNTTSAMTLVAVDGLGTLQGDDRAAALFTIALVAGLFQLALGLLGLGMLTKFVSNSVMVGFLTGISALIILGQLWVLTGYQGEGGSRIEQTAQLLSNLRDVDPATTVVGVGALVLMVLLSRTRLADYSLLIALGMAVLVAWIGDFDSVVLVSSLGEIPRSLPSLDLPRFTLIPEMLLAGIAVGAVGLLQAAGVAQAYPNRHGSENDDSRDFAGQGIANVANSLFQGMAGGGSLSGTALNVGAGAQTRWACVAQSVVVLVAVLLFGGLLSRIPMAGLAALLIYSAVLSIKLPAIAIVSRTSWTSLAAMAVTFLATLTIPLQQAVMVGIALASVLFLYRASIDVRVRQMRVEGDRLVVSAPPEQLPSDAVTVLDIEGNLFYAGVRTLGKLLPDAKQSRHAGVVMRLRGKAEIGSTFFKVIGKYAGDLRARDGVLLLAGVEPRLKERMERAGQLDLVGADRIFLAGHVIGESTTDALRAGEAWLAALPEVRSTVAEAAEPIAVDAIPVVPAGDTATLQTAAASGTETAIASRRRERQILDQAREFVRQSGSRLEDLTARATLLAGAAMLAIGLAAVVFTDKFLHLLMPLIGVLFLLVAAFWTFSALAEMEPVRPRVTGFRMLSAGVAVTTGVSLIIQAFSDYFSLATAQVLLAIGLALLGAIGLISTERGASEPGERIADLTASLALIGLAIVAFLSLQRNGLPIDLLGWLAIGAGCSLFVYTFAGGRRQPPSPISGDSESSVSDSSVTELTAETVAISIAHDAPHAGDVEDVKGDKDGSDS